jgi:hypothetical protein
MDPLGFASFGVTLGKKQILGRIEQLEPRRGVCLYAVPNDFDLALVLIATGPHVELVHGHTAVVPHAKDKTPRLRSEPIETESYL